MGSLVLGPASIIDGHDLPILGLFNVVYHLVPGVSSLSLVLFGGNTKHKLLKSLSMEMSPACERYISLLNHSPGLNLLIDTTPLPLYASLCACVYIYISVCVSA